VIRWMMKKHGTAPLLHAGILTLLLCVPLLFSGCAGNNHELAVKKARAEAALGTSLVQQNQARAGLKHLLEAARLAPENARIQHELAVVYRDLKYYTPSLKHFKRALEIDPDSPEVWNDLGTLYLLLKRPDLAIPWFTKAAETITYKTPHFAYNNLGQAYFEKKEYGKAIESYREALSFARDYSLCWNNLGNAYVAVAQLTEAEKAFKKAIRYDAGYPAPRFHLGKLYLEQKEIKKARQELEEAIRLAPEGPFAEEARGLLARIQ